MVEERYEPKDETFQFSDLEQDSSASPYDTGSEMPTSARNLAMRRYALIGIGLLFVILVVYKFMGTFFGGRKVQPMKHPAVVVTQPVQPRTAPQATQALHSAQQLSQRLAQLESSNGLRQDSVNKVATSLDNLNTTLKQLESRINDLSYNLQSLEQKVDQQESQLATIEKRLTKPRKRKVVRRRRRVVKTRLGYKLQALVPGRAWLISEKGTTLTISEGSRVPGYGKITAIDAQQGEVKTSTGKTFAFSPNEN